MRLPLRLLAAATLAAAPLAVVHAQGRAAPAPTLKKVASVEGITEYALPNGLRVLLVPDATKPTFTINLTIFVGSRHEGYGETGMAHLLEHLLFKGSPRHKSPVKEMNDRGAQWNGTTWVDRTNYYETVPSSDANLEWAVDWEADRFVNSFVSGEDLKSEFTVVRNEFEAGENYPFNVLLQRTTAAAYEWHNYGKSTIGNKADIEGVPIERLQAFYRKWYQPDNAMLVLAGQFDTTRAMKLITEKFGRIPRPVRSMEKGNLLFATYTEEPPQDGERVVALRRTGDVRGIMWGYHVPAGSHPDFAAVEVLARVLGANVTGRLYKAVVEPKLASSSGAFSYQWREPGLFIAYAETRREQSLDSVRLAMEPVLESFASTPVTLQELDRARTELLKNIDLTLNQSDQVGLGLSEWAALGDWRFQFIHRDRIRRVTAEDVQRVARTYLISSNRTLGMFHPTDKPVRAEVPRTPDFGALVAAYRSTEVRTAGEAFDVAPAKIDGRLRKATLASGMKVAMVPKKTLGGAVQVAIELRYGTEASLANRGAVPDLLAAMLGRGTQRRDRAAFKDSLDKLKASAFFYAPAAGTVRVQLETTREQLVPALRLVSEALRQPALSATEFELLRNEQLAEVEQQRTEPGSLGFIAAERAVQPYAKGHPLYVRTLDEQLADLKAATLEQLRAFHGAFYGAQDGAVALAGDFDPAAAERVLAEAFGDWKAREGYAHVARQYKAIDSTGIKIETPDKKMAMFVAATPVNIRSRDPEWAAMQVASWIFAASPLSSRIGERLRQKEGLSYGAGGNLDTDVESRGATYVIQAIYNPANNARLVAAAREELEKALTTGFTAEEVEKAKTAWLQQRFQARAEDRSLVGLMLLRTQNGLTFDGWDGDIERRVQKLTAAEVNATFRKYLDAKRFAWITAGDFANAKAEDTKPKP